MYLTICLFKINKFQTNRNLTQNVLNEVMSGSNQSTKKWGDTISKRGEISRVFVGNTDYKLTTCDDLGESEASLRQLLFGSSQDCLLFLVSFISIVRTKIFGLRKNNWHRYQSKWILFCSICSSWRRFSSCERRKRNAFKTKKVG